MNPFIEGQKVVCIGGIPKYPTPKKGEVNIIDEMLGDYLRFEKYDGETVNWWHHTSFKPVSEVEQETLSKLYEVQS